MASVDKDYADYRGSLPGTCAVSTTPVDFLEKAGSDSGGSFGDSEVSRSSGSNDSGKVGSSGFYMEVWEFVLIALILCLCLACICASIITLANRRRRMMYGPPTALGCTWLLARCR